MLHFLYWGTVVPPLARRIMDEVLDRVHKQLRIAQDRDAALDLGWLYVEPKTGRALLERLEWWQNDGKTALPFHAMIGPLVLYSQLLVITADLNVTDPKIPKKCPRSSVLKPAKN